MNKRTLPLYSLALASLLLLGPVAGAVSAQEQGATVPDKPEEAAAAAPNKPAKDPVAVIDAFIAEKKIDKTQPDWRTSLPMPPKPEFDSNKSYFWDLETNKGRISIKLLPGVAPMHVASLIYLTRLGFYDGLTFHRVIPGFMAQGGCPLGTGTGGPGYQFGGEFSPLVRHTAPGMLSTANAGPNTDGSQFFITFVPTTFLDGKHTIFGGVVDGMDTVKQLEAAGSSSGKTKEKLTIVTATIRVE